MLIIDTLTSTTIYYKQMCVLIKMNTKKIITYYRFNVFQNQKYTLLLITLIYLNSHTTCTKI